LYRFGPFVLLCYNFSSLLAKNGQAKRGVMKDSNCAIFGNSVYRTARIYLRALSFLCWAQKQAILERILQSFFVDYTQPFWIERHGPVARTESPGLDVYYFFPIPSDVRMDWQTRIAWSV
jgi:hypothetical protein